MEGFLPSNLFSFYPKLIQTLKIETTFNWFMPLMISTFSQLLSRLKIIVIVIVNLFPLTLKSTFHQQFLSWLQQCFPTHIIRMYLTFQYIQQHGKYMWTFMTYWELKEVKNAKYSMSSVQLDCVISHTVLLHILFHCSLN